MYLSNCNSFPPQNIKFHFRRYQLKIQCTQHFVSLLVYLPLKNKKRSYQLRSYNVVVVSTFPLFEFLAHLLQGTSISVGPVPFPSGRSVHLPPNNALPHSCRHVIQVEISLSDSDPGVNSDPNWPIGALS